jgi:hypothetical protein
MLAKTFSIIIAVVLFASRLRAEPMRVAYSGVSAAGTPLWLGPVRISGVILNAWSRIARLDLFVLWYHRTGVRVCGNPTHEDLVPKGQYRRADKHS